MVSCGTENTGSNADNKNLSVLDLIIQQDDFDAEDFGIETEDNSVSGGGPDLNPEGREEGTEDDDGSDIDTDIIVEEEDELPETGDMIEIRTPSQHGAWIARFVDKYDAFSESTDGEPLYPAKLYSNNVSAREAYHYNIVNPTTVNRMCQQIQTDPKSSTVKVLVLHINAGPSTHHDALWATMYKTTGTRGWRHPGYHITIDSKGHCNRNRFDDENTYGCSNRSLNSNVAGGPFPFRQNTYRECNVIKSTSSQIINVCWLGNNKSLSDPNASKTTGKKPDEGSPGDFLYRASMSKAQAHSIAKIVKAYIKKYPNIKICGHHQTGPDIKECPSFNVPKWAELCGIPSKNIYSTYVDLGLIYNSRDQAIKDGATSDDVGKPIPGGKRIPSWWTLPILTSESEKNFFFQNAKILANLLGDISTWNINPPATPTNDDNSTPTNEDNNNEEEAKRWQDMDCNEFAAFWHGLNSRGRTIWAQSLRSDDGDENENGESSEDAADRLCRDCKDEINGN